VANEVEILVKVDDKTKHGTDSAKRNVDGLRQSVAVAAGAMVGSLAGSAISKGVAAFSSFMSGSVEAASNLGESVNAVQKVFGAASPQIEAWGKANATSFGLSQRAFNELATPLGAGLKNAGLSMQDTARWTIDLTKRASDMASVFNTTVPEALEAIQSGLRGESDPLERFGIGLSAAKVQAEALAETGKGTAKELTTQELATARLNLIMKESESSAGDFAQTSDGLANSQRIAAAETEELQAKIGEKLTPVMLAVTQAKLKLVEVISDKMLPVFTQLTEFFQEHGGAAQALAIVVGGVLVAAMVAYTIAAAQAAIATIAATWPVLAIIAAVAGLAAGVIYCYQHFETFRTVVNTVLRALRTAFTGWLTSILWVFGKVLDGAAGAFGWMPGIGPKLKAAAAAFHRFANTVTADLRGIPAVKYVNVIALVNGQRQTIQRAVGSANDREGRSATRASGGIIGQAAAGGIRGGLTLVGEQGPELIDAAPGSRVLTADDTARTFAEGGGGGPGGPLVIMLQIGDRTLGEVIIDPLRKVVRARGGDVQAVLSG
jgi:hypothetical protein